MRQDFYYKILDLGAMECDRARMVAVKEKESRMQIPVMAILVHHPKLGYILYDTGNVDNWETELNDYLRENFPIVRHRSLRDALAEEGLEPSDIDLLILSHLHFDHAGNIRLFAGTKAGSHVLVGTKEYERACRWAEDPEVPGYIGRQYLMDGITYDCIDEDLSLAEGVEVFLQTSHSPALLGLRLDVPGEKTLLCVSDAVYTRINYETGLPSGGPNATNAQGFQENLKRLKEMEHRLNAEILFGHDMEQMRMMIERGRT